MANPATPPHPKKAARFGFPDRAARRTALLRACLHKPAPSMAPFDFPALVSTRHAPWRGLAQKEKVMEQTIEFDRLVKQIWGAGEWRVPVVGGNRSRQVLLSRRVRDLAEYVEGLTTILVEQAKDAGDPINRACVGEVVWGGGLRLTGLFHLDLDRVWRRVPAAEARVRHRMAAYGDPDPRLWEWTMGAIYRGEVSTDGVKAKYPKIHFPGRTPEEDGFWRRSSLDHVPVVGASQAWLKAPMDAARRERVCRDKRIAQAIRLAKQEIHLKIRLRQIKAVGTETEVIRSFEQLADELDMSSGSSNETRRMLREQSRQSRRVGRMML